MKPTDIPISNNCFEIIPFVFNQNFIHCSLFEEIAETGSLSTDK